MLPFEHDDSRLTGEKVLYFGSVDAIGSRNLFYEMYPLRLFGGFRLLRYLRHNKKFKPDQPRGPVRISSACRFLNF
jgi:hypothetical protein